MCEPGCGCPDGQVLNEETMTCVELTSCPCFHGGRSYEDGYTFKKDCQTWFVDYLFFDILFSKL